MRGHTLRLAGAVLIALAVTARPVVAADDKPIIQKMKFVEKGDQLVVSTVLTQLFDSTAYEAMSSGFESTVLIRMWLYRKGESDPIAFQVLQRRVIYDMWDEVYEVQLEGGGKARTKKVKYKAEALKLLTALDRVPIAHVDDVPYEDQHVLVLVAELNPVSEETLAEVRRWLTEGNGGGLDRGGGLFGSVVSVFVNPKIAEADRVLRMRSQRFFRPTPK